MKGTPLTLKMFGLLYIVLGLNSVYQIVTVTGFNGVPKVFSSSKAFVLFGIPSVGSLLQVIGGASLCFVNDWRRCFILLVLTGGVLVTLSVSQFLVLADEGGWHVLRLVIDFVAYGLILWYFSRPGVKAQFVKRRTDG